MAKLGFARWAVTPAERAIAIGIAYVEVRELLQYREFEAELDARGIEDHGGVRYVWRRLENQVGALAWRWI